MRSSAGPNTAIAAAARTVESAAAASAGRQPRVKPTASTMVAASTSSTAHARNADAKAKTADAT